jgi:hypothetical protein
MNSLPTRRLPLPEAFFIEKLRVLGCRIRDAVLRSRTGLSLEELAAVEEIHKEGDTLYHIDRAVEDLLVEFVEREIAAHCPCVLIAEGVSGEGLRLGKATQWGRENSVRLIVDPIDGTRGLMFDKRSAWVLCGVAPDLGNETTLADIVAAVQTEIPTSRQWRSDQLWAVRGGGAQGEWVAILGDAVERGPLRTRPSAAPDLRHGFASFARFFPGARDVIADIEEEVLRRVAGPFQPGQATVFEDQYISTGGQLYELFMGHDRMVADLRPLTQTILRERGLPPALTSHPYDLATALIAQEAGVEVTDPNGGPLRYPLNVTTECAWIGYANAIIRRAVEPVLQAVLRERNLL